MASADFTAPHRVDEKAFTRDRKLPVPQLVRFLLNLRKGANQDELARFVEVVCDHPLADSVSKSALTQARAKLRPEAFSELSDVLVNGAMRTRPMRRWHGFRLLAVDGSTFLLPKEPAIVAAFGQTEEVTPQARFSRLYDVLNRVVVAADNSAATSRAATAARPPPAHASPDWPPQCSAEWSNTAHSEQFVRVLYPYHPFYGQELAVVREDKSGLLFMKAPGGFVQGLPRWLTDASACATVRSATDPLCSAQALLQLAALIRTLKASELSG